MLYNPKPNKCALLFNHLAYKVRGVTPSANSPIPIASQGVTGDSALHSPKFCQPNPIQKSVSNFPPSYIHSRLREDLSFNQSQNQVPNKSFEQHQFHTLSFCRMHQNSCISIHTAIYAPEHFMNNFMHITRTDDPPIDPAGPSFFLSPYK